MRHLLIALGLCGAAFWAAGADHAVAGPPPQGVVAQDCHVLSSQISDSQIWWTYFRGSKEVEFNFNGPTYREWYSKTACFRTQADCKAWLYWTQSEYPDFMNFKLCTRGL